MADNVNRSISQLDEQTSIDRDAIIPIVIGNSNKKISLSKILDYSSDLKNAKVLGDDDEVYRLIVKNGTLEAIPDKIYSASPAKVGDNINFDGLIINQIYGGGSNINNTAVSHGFIELYNLRDDIDFNLKGLYLWYRAKAGNWQSLALEGIIPARHSFLIRCKQHSTLYDESVRCNIDRYDMNWDVSLSDKGFSVYLCVGADTPEDNPVRQTKDTEGNVTYTNNRYIDLIGGGGKDSNETIWAYETRYLHCMDKDTALHRIDFANSGGYNIGSNALITGNNDCDCEPLDYRTCNALIYKPRCLADGRWSEFYDKETQSIACPSMINLNYGKKQNTICFNFHTPLSEFGYVRYRKLGETKWNTVPTTTKMSLCVETDWHTVHKAKVTDLAYAIYEYQVGYEGCWSEITTFKVKDWNDTTTNPTMNILWTSDQQSFNEKEYSVWKACARFFNQTDYSDYMMHLNTGDISQSANRVFEWRDYYKCAGVICKNIPHMFTCGNNDLIDNKKSDAFNDYINIEDPIYNSVYYFDTGYVHWVCLNSNTDDTYVNGIGSVGGFDNTDDFLEAQGKWLDEHLTEVESRSTQPKWVIVYSHLSPFSVVREKRLQRWVNVAEKHKIDLWLCGHNHCYARSKALYTGYDYHKSPAYNDYRTKVSTGSSELKIVNEYKADGTTEVNRTEDKTNGTVYILMQATGFKLLTGKFKPVTLTQLAGTKHVNSDNSPWWVTTQSLPQNPTYGELSITPEKIVFTAYQIEGIVGYDEFKNVILNTTDFSKISKTAFDTLTINYNANRKK